MHVRQSIQPLADRLVSNNSADVQKLKNDDPASGQMNQLNKILTNTIDNINSKLEEIYYSIARRVNVAVNLSIHQS